MVSLRAVPDEPIEPFCVRQDSTTDQWRVDYGQPGPPVVMSAVFETEEQAWKHAVAAGFPASRHYSVRSD